MNYCNTGAAARHATSPQRIAADNLRPIGHSRSTMLPAVELRRLVAMMVD